jgi:hypothetical protein
LTERVVADIGYDPFLASDFEYARDGMDALSAISLTLAAAGLIQSCLLLLHAWEHRRYHRSRLGAPLESQDSPHVTLYAPCRGVDVGMEANLQALFEQRYPRFDLSFLIESERDPAVEIIRRLQARFPQIGCRIIFTGTATDCGQKVHNLMRGTEAIGPETGVLAFVDSDARPHPEWLTRLVDRLRSGKFAIATGYRWYAPLSATLPNRLLSAINCNVAGLMGPHGFNLVWGGAWAIRSEDFRRLGLSDAWRGSLSDDLVVSRLVHEARLKVAYEPHCLVRSPAEFTWGTLAEFLRRQYLVVRVYAPKWWRFAILSTALSNLLFWGLGGAAIWSVWNGGRCGIAAAAFAAYYLLGALRGAISSRAIRPFVDVADEEYQSVARVNVWGWPVVSAAVGLGLAASAVGRTICWRGIEYRLESPSCTQILSRTETESSAASPHQLVRSAA